MTKYTAEDFANARFAEHEDGRVASRANPESSVAPWLLISEGGFIEWRDDVEMRVFGWVPVPSKPVLTDSEVGELVPISLPEEYLTGFIDGFERAGGAIIPDPEPTNTDRLEQIMNNSGARIDAKGIAKYLNDSGVTAPEDNA